MIECQYDQELFYDKYILCKPNGDDEEDLYDENLANKDNEDMVISNKFSRDIMEDYFGFHLSTTVELLERIDDDVLKLSIKNYSSTP